MPVAMRRRSESGNQASAGDVLDRVYCTLHSVHGGQSEEEGIEGDVRLLCVRCSLYVAFSGHMHFVCTMYALCMHFSAEAGNPSKSKAEWTFSAFVCSVCSRFGSSSFFRRFPFKANAYNAYKCIQPCPKTALSSTARYVFAVCTSFARQLHTKSAYNAPASMPAKRKNSGRA